ncbi:hypothetical protein [Shewanella sp. YIC-542]|uniref:AbiU2 domain-containing protein n=1 Tax=Shewanella mytili TaxID=3377111 RepID=UPI00398E8E56
MSSENIETMQSIVADIATEFTLYSQLFVKPESIDLLNKTAATVFSSYQRSLLNTIYISISRILDPATSSSDKDSNLSFNFLIKELKLTENKELSELLSNTQQLFVATGIKKYRNKVISHNDLRTIKNKTQHLSLNYDDLTLLIHNLWALLNMIRFVSGETDVLMTTGTEIIMYDDGDNLLDCLRNRI